MLSRRHLIQLTGSAAVGSLLAGCATLGNGSTLAQTAVTALQAVATEITQVIPQLITAGLGGNTLSAVQNIVAEIQQVLSGVSNAMTQSQGQSILQQVESYINDLAPLVLPFVSAIPGGSIVGLIVAALPAIEAVVGVAFTYLTNIAQGLATTAPTTATRPRAVFGQNSNLYLQLLEQRAKASRRYRHHR